VFGLDTVAAAARPGPETHSSATALSQELFVNLQSGREGLHRVNMAFQMARNQRKLNRPVTIFFNINAPELATKGLPTALRWRDNAPIKDQVAELIGLGVTVHRGGPHPPRHGQHGLLTDTPERKHSR
jgi:hypothetical protein